MEQAIKKTPNSTESTGKKESCHVRHPAGDGKSGQTVGGKYTTKTVRLQTEYMDTR